MLELPELLLELPELYPVLAGLRPVFVPGLPKQSALDDAFDELRAEYRIFPTTPRADGRPQGGGGAAGFVVRGGSGELALTGSGAGKFLREVPPVTVKPDTVFTEDKTSKNRNAIENHAE